MSFFGWFSKRKLRAAVKSYEAAGHTGRTNAALHAVNCAQTDQLSTGQITSLIAERRAAGKPTGKLEAALRDRGNVGAIIKKLEAAGHTGRTNVALHAANCAQTNSLSTGQITSLIASREAAGKPTGKLRAARRNR